MTAFYNKQTNKVDGNTFFCCIPGKCFDNKETQLIRYAEKTINETVDEKLSSRTVKFFNFFLLNAIVSRTRNNISKGIDKARQIIPGTIKKLLNYTICIFFIFTIPILGLALLIYFNVLNMNLSIENKIIILVIMCIFDIIVVSITVARYGKSKMDKYVEQITNEVSPI